MADTEDPNIATLRRYFWLALAALTPEARAVEALASTLAERDRRIAALEGRRRESRQLLHRLTKYVKEDRATTPGKTRLARLTEQVVDYLARTGEPTDILRGDTEREPSRDYEDSDTATVRARLEWLAARMDESNPEQEDNSDALAALTRLGERLRALEAPPAPAPGELALDGPLTLTVSIPQRDGCKGCGGPATITLAVGVTTYSCHEGFRCLPDCNYEEPDIAF